MQPNLPQSFMIARLDRPPFAPASPWPAGSVDLIPWDKLTSFFTEHLS